MKYFVVFMRDTPEPTGEEGDGAEMESPRVYELVDEFTPVVSRHTIFEDQYNEILRGSSMDLVFFPDAIIRFSSQGYVLCHFPSRSPSFPKRHQNGEMVELCGHYLTMEDYNMASAKRVCGDVGGLLCWTKAMSFFFGVN